MKRHALCIAFAVLFSTFLYSFASAGNHNFSTTLCKFVSTDDAARAEQLAAPKIIWKKKTPQPFKELILSWNAFRPTRGVLVIYGSLLVDGKWSDWHKLATWGRSLQKTFLNDTHPHVHTKHCRIEVQNDRMATGFRAKVEFKGGAEAKVFKAFFACMSDFALRREIVPRNLPSVMIKNVPRQSQMVLPHERCKDLCSPVSTSLLVTYFKQTLTGRQFTRGLERYAQEFAHNAHDQNPSFDIYGNWILNTAHAFHEAGGNVYFSVRRLNSFYDLYALLKKKTPVAVSVRRLQGGATPYANGHIMVVVGWNAKRRRVICVDPAFDANHRTLKSYPIHAFLKAWGRSNNLSYVPTLKNNIM